MAWPLGHVISIGAELAFTMEEDFIMRQTISLNQKWAFTKQASALPAAMPENWYWVNLPHSWNAIDGQDSGGDYFRGTAYYAKTMEKIDRPATDRYYLEVMGANSTAVF